MSAEQEKKKLLPKKPFDKNNFEQKLSTLVSSNNIEGVKYQISQGIDVNKKIDGLYAIKFAAESGNIEILKLLIEAGAKVNVRCGYGEQPLIFYAKNLETLKVLVGVGADIDLRCNDDQNLLKMAVRRKQLDVIEYLVGSCGADISVTDYNLCTPLHQACISTIPDAQGLSLEVVKLLLKNHARTDLLDFDENTPFMCLLLHQKPLDDEFLKFFKFILKYTDVTDFHLETYEISFFVDKTNESLCKIFLEHVALLLSLGVPVWSHEYYISRRTDYNDYFEKCKNELILAKSTKLNKSWLTFYNLLVDDNKKLKNYAGNEDLVDDFKSLNFIGKFPIYGAQMREKVRKGIMRREIFDKSCIMLSDCLPIFNPNHLIIRDILDCVVNTKDLSKFCEK